MYEAFAKELVQMAEHDLAVRDSLLKANMLTGGGYNAVMENVHKQNASRLREIIAQIAWPTISRVGPEASEAAWLIAQHAIGEPQFMKSCHELITDSLNDVNPQHAAFLYDRICYFEGKPQRYGTQYHDGVLYPVEDRNRVNQLRISVGMEPQDWKKIVEITPAQHGTDLHKDSSFNEWRKKVGWI